MIFMKKIFNFLLSFLLILGIAKSQNYQASITSGVFTGTPFWNPYYLIGADSINVNDTYLRLYNNIRFSGKMNNFSVKFSGLRSDNISQDNNISETKLYQLYAKYSFNKGYVKAGRFTEFNRWLIGSVDGAAFKYSVNKNFKLSAYGGLNVRYGNPFKSKKQESLIYGDFAYKTKGLGAKIRYFHTDKLDLAGLDFFSKLGFANINANVGYDLSNNRINDGGLGFNGVIGSRFQWFGNYRLMRSREWQSLVFTDFFQRYLIGFSYILPWHFRIDARQFTVTTDKYTNYISYLALQHKYFLIGINYLDGDSYSRRLGITVGGHYSIFKKLQISAGIGSVDYLINDNYYNNVQSLVSYLRIKYKIIDNLIINGYVNYYDKNPVLNENFRGGATVQYKFGSK